MDSALQLVRVDLRVVGHTHHHLAALSEFDRVAGQIDQNLPQPVWVPIHTPRHGRVHIAYKFQSLGRSPRREQAIRAARLAGLGLADVVDEDASPEEVAWLLARPRTLPAGALAASGVALDGASRAARVLAALAGRRVVAA